MIARFSQLLNLALQNKKQDVIDSIAPDMDYLAKKDWLASLWLAECLSIIGEGEKAMNYLHQVVKLGGINLPFLTQHDRFLANIRDNPRFHHIVHGMEAKYPTERERVSRWLEENELL